MPSDQPPGGVLRATPTPSSLRRYEHVFDNRGVVSPAPALEVARAALAAAELRTGVRSAPHVPAESSVPARVEEQPLMAVLDGGRLPRGDVAEVVGSAHLLLALLAVSQGEEWVAVVGMPSLGLLAAHEVGINLEHTAVVPDVHGRGAEAVGALLDGMAYVVVGPDVQLTAGERRQLRARTRDRSSGLVATRQWENAGQRLHVTAHRWSGVDAGAGFLRRCRLEVDRWTRGRTGAWDLTLPAVRPDGSVTAGTARPRTAAAVSPLRVVG